MDKNAIKKFAIWARKELIARVTQRAYLYGVDGEQELDAEQKEVNGRLLSAVERRQRRTLVNRVKEKGFESVMDEAAYTWFNRFAALRYMEVNGVLPTRVRVFTDNEGAFQPQILTECLTMDNLEGLNKEIVFALKEQDATDELYKYLLITQCNALGTILPAMFEQIEDYTELLLPDNLLRQGSVIEQMVTTIPEDDWRDAVQIIGWLYQYYNSEPKDAVFAALKKNVKISKENIPAATQLFTPDWIVRYMVENSLGRIWIEHKLAATDTSYEPTTEADPSGEGGTRSMTEVVSPEASLAKEHFDWKYYLPEAKQEPDVAAELKKLRAERKDLAPTDIKVIDPCMGSGHILVYAFDVLVQIYKDAGFGERAIPELILQNNLYGLDIDDRAYQLAYFAVMMRAWHYNHRILRKHIEPHLCAIQESNGLNKWSDATTDMSGNQLTLKNQFIELADYLIDTFQNAKEYGSILTVKEANYDGLLDYIKEIQQHGANDLAVSAWIGEIADRMPALIKQAKIMSGKYDVCVTNPPYMSSSMSDPLSTYLKKNYPTSKSDLFAVFIERCSNFLCENSFQAMITQHAWMFLSSYEKLRQKIMRQCIVNMAHLGPHAFEEIAGEVVQTTAFVLKKGHIPNYYSKFVRLITASNQKEKEKKFLQKHDLYITDTDNFKKIPGKPIAYWVTSDFINAFKDGKRLDELATPKKGLVTTDNARFLRLWPEVNFYSTLINCKNKETAQHSNKKWFPLNKGGDYRRWYGNKNFLINWYHDGMEIKQAIIKKYHGGSYTKEIRNEDKYFKDSITWSALTTGLPSFRFSDYGALFDSAGSSMFPINEKEYILGLLNSKVVDEILKVLNPTLNYGAGTIGKIPVVFSNNHKTSIISLVSKNVNKARNDWDSFETSWDFSRHPLLPLQSSATVAACYDAFHTACEERFLTLKSNEEELNRIFIDIYGLQDELTPDVADKDVTVARIYDTKDDIPDSMKGNNYVLTKSDVVKSLLSYAVGCMFGRYSLDVPGLAYAGGEFDWSKYPTFRPDEDDIIPICDDEYFEDDIVDRFCTWLRTVYGEEHYQENLQFLSDALGGKGSPLENIRSYFLNDFYKDHCKTYKKRPIYWLFDAGKKNSFKALVYIHRYDRDTMARMRTGYVYKQQELYKTRIETYKKRVDTAASQADKNKYKKELKRLQDQFDEIHAYEEKIHHYADLRQEIDLDDGVKRNYALFADVLAKIK